MSQLLTMADVVERAIALGGEREAVVDGQIRESYARLGNRAGSVAQHFNTAGISEGDRIGGLFRNGRYASECVAVAALAGVVYLPLNYFLTEGELIHIVRSTGMRALIYCPTFAAKVARLREHCPALEIVLPTSDDADLSYEAWADEAMPLAAKPGRAASDPFLILFTSGTTGAPKGVTLSHANVIANAESFVRGLEMTTDSRGLLINPHFFSAGINCTIIPIMLVGGTVVVSDGFNSARFLETVEKERITNCQMVPTMLIRLLDHEGVRAYDLSSLRTVSYGSSPMPRTRLQQAISVFGPIFVQTYGMTEIPELLLILSKEDHVADSDHPRLTSAGRPVDPSNVRIVDESGRDVATETQGELWVRGRSRMTGYWSMPEATAQAIRNGWLATGDLARMDKDGYVYIVGRSKEIINSGGIKISPVEVEQILFSHPAVADAMVAGVPDPEWGEMVKAFIVLKPGCSATATDIMAFCAPRLASYKKPKAISFVASLPKTPTGKPMRKGLA